MNFLKSLSVGALSLAFFLQASAQNFISAYDSFSSDKVGYFTMQDGSKIEGTVSKIKRTKGLIEQIVVIKTGTKDKTPLKGDQIKSMYIYPSGFSKLGTALDKATTLERWEEGTGVDDKLIKEGYAYFEATEVQLKKEKKVLLMQLLNPAFCGKIKVFHDPFANETGGLAVGGLQVTGGEDKSHYVKVGNNTATRLFKKNYRESFNEIFPDCPEFHKAFENKKPTWGDFDKNVFEYTKSCTK